MCNSALGGAVMRTIKMIPLDHLPCLVVLFYARATFQVATVIPGKFFWV